MVLVSLYCVSTIQLLGVLKPYSRTVTRIMTYERNTAVCAPANLGLVGVDEYPRVAKRATSAIARDNTLMCPANGLLVDKVDSGVWARLWIIC